jgi:tRNA1(Val) A37 N6-methylase TrmN6
MSPDLAEEITDNAALGGRLQLLQPRKGHRFGHDAILLAAATPARASDRVVELGSGVGAAGLALAARVSGIHLTLIEIDSKLAALAEKNIERNGFAERAKAYCLDVTAPHGVFSAAGLAAGDTDCVVMNPPFRDPAQSAPSPDERRRVAHVGGREVLDTWVSVACRLLCAGGALTLIYRADGLDDICEALSPAFGDVVILPVLSKPGTQAIRVLVRALKGGQSPSLRLAGLLLNDTSGKPSEEAEAVLRHGAALKMGV